MNEWLRINTTSLLGFRLGFTMVGADHFLNSFLLTAALRTPAQVADRPQGCFYSLLLKVADVQITNVLSHHGCIVHFLYEGLHLWFCWFSVVYHCELRPIFKSHVVVHAFQYSIVPTDPSNSRLVSKLTFMCRFLEKVVLIQLQYLLLANDIYATYAWNWVAVDLTARMKYWYPDIRRHRLDAVLEGHVWSCKWSVRQ